MIDTQRWERCEDCSWDKPISLPSKTHRFGGRRHRLGNGHTVVAYWVDITEAPQ